MSATHFHLNGQPRDLADADPSQSLLRWLRHDRLTGTKEGCADGDCGACTVALVEPDRDGTPRYRAVNSCLLPIGQVVGRSVLTVEALAQGEQLHPVQQALVECAGSQCGYCTPGFVMSLFVGQQNDERGDAVFEGNLCRCTGYQPIRAACASLPALTSDDPWRHALSTTAAAGEAALGTWSSPLTIAQALALKADRPEAAWIAGATDLGVALSHGHAVAPRFIALDRVVELQALDVDAARVRIGAGVSLTRIERELAGVFPALDRMLPWFAARQVRNRATLGGNLGSASPIGDLLPVLLALEATVHLRGPAGARDLSIDGYFLDYRRTARRPEELIEAVTIPRRAARIDASYKVAKRQTDDISIVAAAFALEFDELRRVAQVRLAYGGVAAIPRRAREVEDFLVGRTLDAGTVAHAAAQLHDAFEPIDDHRASADYRRALCATFFEKFAAEVSA